MLFEATGGADMRDLAVLKTGLLALVPRYFPAPYDVQATALMERYVDYRVALGGLKPLTDPRALRAALDTQGTTANERYAQRRTH